MAHSTEVFAAATRAASLAPDELQTFRVLSLADARELDAATALIVPTDDTPGAREARVVHFIDQAMATFAPEEKPRIAASLAELRKRARRRNSSSFAALPEPQQLRILQEMEKDAEEPFNTIWGLTILGMLANPSYGGNYAKTGWKWIGFNDQFSWAAPYGWYDRDEK